VSGWADADRIHQHDRDEIEVLRAAMSIIEVAEALGVQIHADPPPRITCPEPGHVQSGDSAPAWVYIGDSGTERWHCSCGAGGDVFGYVVTAERADDFREALEVIRDLAAQVEVTERERPAARRQASSMPPERRGRRPRVTSPTVLRECHRWAEDRGWDLSVVTSMLGPDRVEFVWDEVWESPFLRVYTDDRRTSWQDRGVGDGPKWRSAHGRTQHVFLYEPDRSAGRPLVVEGAADWLTVVVAQHDLDERFEAWGLPGAGRGGLLPQRPHWCVVLDNDDAGLAGRALIDETQIEPVRHIYLPTEFHDINDVWTALTRRERAEWIHELTDAKDHS
jgi:hypothetical protein